MSALLLLAQVCLGLTASAHPPLPLLYLQEPGSELTLDPRVQRDAPAFYVVDPSRYQREVLDDDDDSEMTRSKRKTPLSFLFFEQDGRSQRKVADSDPQEADATGSENQQGLYNGYSADDQEATCNDFACKSKCLATTWKQNGGRCQDGRCVCGESKSKKRNRKYKKAKKPSKKIRG